MNPEVVIPTTMFVGLTIVLCLFFWFRYRMRSEMQATIRTAIDKGQELSPEIIDRLGQPQVSRDRDIRVALIWIAIAVSLVIFGAMIPEDTDEAQRVMAGLAAFPGCLGIAYLIMWRFTDRNK